MKPKFILSVVLICSLFKAQAQVFPESDAIWSIQKDYLKGEELINKVQHYGLSGDTIINGITYNKLYLLNDTTLNISSEDEYLGGFRQEGKQVWFQPSSSLLYPLYDDLPYSEETLLYDFSKNVGDTIWHNAVAFSDSYWTMKDSITASVIRSIGIDEQDRKIYYTEELFYSGRRDRWIEGIGSVEYGLWGFMFPLPTCQCPAPHLNCFKQGNEVKYINNLKCNSCFCDTVANISNKNTVSLEVISENNCIRIKGESSVFPCELKLFSPIGQLVLEKLLQSNTEEIPINQLKGIYLYQVQKNREIMKTGKIIIK